jgi:ferredoxin--NADP+ reductase
VEIEARAGVPALLRIQRTRLDGERAVGTGEFEEIPCGLVIKAVGHRGVALAGLPFDEARGVIPNSAGRIEPGLYCVGWIKRGASGLIGHNRKDAMETVISLLADFA